MDRRKISCCNLLRASANLIVAHLTLTRRNGSYDSFWAFLNSWRSLSISLRRSFTLSSSCLDIGSCVWNTPEAKKKVFIVFILIKDDAPCLMCGIIGESSFSFWTLVSSELVPRFPLPDRAFLPLYMPPAKRWGGIVLEPRPPAQPDPSPCRQFRIIVLSFGFLVLAPESLIEPKLDLLLHSKILEKSLWMLNKV